MATPSSWHLLPPELIEHQIAQIDLLMAMYPDEEVAIDTQSRNLLETFKSHVENQNAPQLELQNAPSVVVSLNLVVSGAHRLEIDIEVPFSYANDVSQEQGSRIKVRIRQPIWMNRTTTTQLNSQIQEHEDLFSMIEFANQTATDHIALEEASKLEQSTKSQSQDPTGPLVRAWFYFPSISTRSKRDDFIIHAPSYSLTGFLFAGKPGLLCLEGTSSSIDAYMKFIKTESWGDIPAHHKKVSERYREKENVERVFADMQEITDSVGERRGARANRGDMKAVEEWLGEKGLGDALTKVLM
ncbi:hypothetical protein DM02DRAFT_611658 [Periconia macrospinosa]|uniref:Small nuclear ribonucleoprotein Prp3 C-terminal domain-containing protein n=1 Tax=Periconia macrospinosa TaxID=97972 RepID=A0A2V1E0Z4_9PLEO|nr:hypothetical protein DM02DRAFT_611658 [Periconia macrospinosa]